MSDTENINIRIRLKEAARFAVETRRARREIDKLGNAAEEADLKARKASKGYSLLQRTLQLTKTAGLIAGFTLLAQGALASGGAVVGLVAALAPLVGLLGTLPAFAVLGGQGLGVVALALMGVTDAVGGLNAQIDPRKFALLSRPAQDFALQLDALKPKVLGLQRSVQRGLFPGLTAGLNAAAPAIAQLQGPLAGTGRVIGLFGARLGKLVGSRGFLRDLRDQAYFNNIQMTRLGGAGLDLVAVFDDLMVTSRPLVASLVLLVAGWAASAHRMTDAGRASGGLQRGFHDVWVTTSRVFRIVFALAHALWNVGRVGKAAIGGGLLLALLHGAQALERWTASTDGVHRLTQAFDGGQRTLGQIAHFASEIATGVGPSVVRLTRDMVAAFEPLLSGGGGGAVAGLKLYIDGLDLLARALHTVETTVPGATTALSLFLALMLVNSKLQVIGFARDGLGLVTRGMRLLAVATGLATAAGAAEMGIMEATTAAATGMWLAITGPVGLVVIAIAAVTAGVVALYLKWSWFHRAVDNTFGFIKSHWPLLLAILTGPIGLAVLAITSHFDTIKATANTVVSWIANRFRQLLGFFGRIKNGITSLPGRLLHGATSFLPGRATGGVVAPGENATVVGERGPEIARLPVGTRIVPHTASLSAPRMTPVHPVGTAAPTSGSGRPIHVHSSVDLKVDRRTLAKAVSEAIADEKAGG